MNALLECVEVAGPEVDASIVWLHGLGADGNDFVDLVPELGLGRTRFVFPHAPTRPVTINGGYVMRAWYDIQAIDGRRILQSEADVRDSAAHVERLLERERARGIAAGRILLAGFSQGGAMALHVGVRHRHALAGLLVLSAYEPLPELRRKEASDENASTPILMCHGQFDPVVPMWLGRATFDALAAERPEGSMSWRDYPMGHQVCMPQVRDIAAWLRARLG